MWNGDLVVQGFTFKPVDRELNFDNNVTLALTKKTLQLKIQYINMY